MLIKERIIQLIEYKKIPKEEFYIRIGMTSANFRGKAKKTPLNSTAIENILSEIPDVNPEWLLTGNGPMLKNDDEKKTKRIYDENIQMLFEAEESYNKLHKDHEINLYDINAAANLQTLFESGQQNVIGKLRIPNLPKCDGAIYLRGDSMYPLLKPGDIVIYKILNNLSNLTFGEMYLIDYAIDGDDYLVVKYINASELENHIRLVSYNPHFSPMDIPLSSVRSIAIIKASVRINTLV
jgi:phage repressor protein C with HTH and peptisase S24 domain